LERGLFLTAYWYYRKSNRRYWYSPYFIPKGIF